MKQRLANSVDKKASVKQDRAAKLSLKAEQLRHEATEARFYANKAGEIAASAQALTEQKLEAMREASQMLARITLAEKKNKKFRDKKYIRYKPKLYVRHLPKCISFVAYRAGQDEIKRE